MKSLNAGKRLNDAWDGGVGVLNVLPEETEAFRKAGPRHGFKLVIQKHADGTAQVFIHSKPGHEWRGTKGGWVLKQTA